MKLSHLLRLSTLLLAVSGAVLRGQTAPSSLAARMQADQGKIQAHFRDKQYAELTRLLQDHADADGFYDLEPELRSHTHYNLACALALSGRKSEALAYLGLAIGEGFKNYENLKTDPDLESLRKESGFAALLAITKTRGDFMTILRRYKAYAGPQADAKAPFIYQPSEDPDLVRFREAYALKEIAGKGNDSSRLLNLMRWVHAKVRHDGNSANPEPRNAMHLLEVCQKEGRGINCRMMATVLSEACLALGYKARHITCLPLDEKDPDCHVITTVWLEGAQKWIYLDPTFEAYFTDADGGLLSIDEVRTRLIQGEPLNLCKEANWNGQKKDPAHYLNYMAKNLVRLQCPQESAFGYESRQERRSYVELGPLNLPPRGRQGVSYIHDPAVFWAKP